MEKSYLKVDNYIKEQVLNGCLKAGDRLLPERELALLLDVSRNSVREGLRILENMGVISSQQGSGNYISSDFDETIVSVMSYMYVLKEMDMDQITEFRYALEWQAMNLAIKKATENQKKRMLELVEQMSEAKTEDLRGALDKEIHYLIIESAGNEYMTTTFKALTCIMERYIHQMRDKIILGMSNDEGLTQVHRMIVEALVEGDLKKGIDGLKLHYQYINEYKNT
ncbi:Pyruvate dehydrogenase complex repressor [uncultured Roseburia sp.]|uniref:FCD domain-containing protein n=1 Tax=Brotonthovivens ammoniilytica TaxID=2981725 RepID=A0ABT2THD4_9FIRM|nr:FCD domain-containing protein [Brotonthovivens ammoniilytica]MCU6761532.1 FCD domain-containing protein [Brotonthovivens ammoniilytica]SCI31136.1 Pyruvate dehydrogenase complex repressor [uncultured Roseburia sp.]